MKESELEKGEKSLKATFLGSLDLRNLQKWKGDFSFPKEKYNEIMQRNQEKRDIFCLEFCTGCGRILTLEKELAFSFYRDLFLEQEHPFLEELKNLNKKTQYIENDICANCAEDFLKLEKKDKNLKVKAIPEIKNL